MRRGCLPVLTGLVLALPVLPAGAQDTGSGRVTIVPAPSAEVTIISPRSVTGTVAVGSPQTETAAPVADQAARAPSVPPGGAGGSQPQSPPPAPPSQARATGTVTTAPATSAYVPLVPGDAAPPRAQPVPVPQSRIGGNAPDAVPPADISPQSLPANADGAVRRFSAEPDLFTQDNGEALYRTTCEACHMRDGKGAAGAGEYPPLAGNPKLVSKYYIVEVLLNGYHGMPRFGDQMTDAQVAAVTNYVRGNLGLNDFEGMLTAEDVSGLRGR